MLNYQLIPTDTNCNVPIHVVLPGSQARFPRQASHMASKAASALKDNLAKPQEIKAWVPQNFHRNLEPWNHGVWLSIEFPEEFPYGHRILFPSPEFPYLPLSGIIFYPRFGNRSYPYCILPVMAGQQIPSLMVYHFRDVQNKKIAKHGAFTNICLGFFENIYTRHPGLPAKYRENLPRLQPSSTSVMSNLRWAQTKLSAMSKDDMRNTGNCAWKLKEILES